MMITTTTREPVQVKTETTDHIIGPYLSLREIEKLAILKALKTHNYNKTHTARRLGIGIRTLQRKIKQYEAEAKLGSLPVW